MRFVGYTKIKVIALLVLFAVVLGTVNVAAADNNNIPTLNKGILSYGGSSINLFSYQFDCTGKEKWNNILISQESVSGGLYLQPVLYGDYIYLAGAVFIPREVDFDNSVEYQNQQVYLGTVYTCLWRFKANNLGKPELIAGIISYESWGTPYDTSINESNKNEMGGTSSSKVLYNWGKGRFIPHVFVSHYYPDRLYIAHETPLKDAASGQAYMLQYFTRDQLDTPNAQSTEVFWVNSEWRKPMNREPAAFYFEEVGKDYICVTSFPKGYNGKVYYDFFDVSTPKEPKYVKAKGKMITKDEVDKQKQKNGG